jgi:hypothetical protein
MIITIVFFYHKWHRTWPPRDPAAADKRETASFSIEYCKNTSVAKSVSANRVSLPFRQLKPRCPPLYSIRLSSAIYLNLGNPRDYVLCEDHSRSVRIGSRILLEITRASRLSTLSVVATRGFCAHRYSGMSSPRGSRQSCSVCV